MRIVVTGANGQVGWELGCSLSLLGEVIALGREECDLSRPECLPDVIRGLRPDVLVNAAAYTAVDRAEDEEALATLVNGTAVRVLAEEARAAGALFVHYSTDYVFDGTKASAYTEQDRPNPINAYGRSKLAGEMAVRQARGPYLILRTSWVYSTRGQNFMRTILRRAREQGQLKIVADQIGAPTWARSIADATAIIVRAACRERSQNAFVSEIINVTASGSTSWHGFAEAILAEVGSGNGALEGAPRLCPIRSEEYASRAVRPKNSQLSGTRLATRFRIALPDWRLALTHCLRDLGACSRL